MAVDIKSIYKKIVSIVSHDGELYIASDSTIYKIKDGKPVVFIRLMDLDVADAEWAEKNYQTQIVPRCEF